MSIQFRCDQCAREYDLPEKAAGKKAKCECGAMLVVPATTPSTDPAETFDPAEPSEILSRPAPKLPRTLAAAAQQASPPPLVKAPPVVLKPEVSAEPPPPPLVAEPAASLSESPPPLPPPYQAGGAAFAPAETIEKRYRNLRAYCGWLRLVGWLVVASTGLIIVGGLAVAIPRLEFVGSDPLAIAALLLPTLVTAATGAGLFVLINAIAELFHVLMDIEENTRQR